MEEIKQHFTVIHQQPGIEGAKKMIELAGRTSYKTEGKITPTSYEKFFSNMQKNQHLATFEFGTVYAIIPESYDDEEVSSMLEFLKNNKYSRVVYEQGMFYITTNYRVLEENNLYDLLMFVTEDNLPTKWHKQRYTVMMTICRQVTHETVRMRGSFGNSFLQESTRFCNYINERFGSSIAFAKPTWIDDEKNNVAPIDDRKFFKKYWDKFRFWLADVPDYQSLTTKEYYYEALKSCEKFYFGLSARNWRPQQCALVLNNAVKADICVQMYLEDWEHFFDLRTSYIALTGEPHPMMCEIADGIYDEFKRLGICEKLENGEWVDNY